MRYVFWRIPWRKNQSWLSLVARQEVSCGKLMWCAVSTMHHQNLSRFLIKILDLAVCWEVHLTNILQSFGEKQLIYSTSRQIIIYYTLYLMIRLIIYFHLHRNLRSLSSCRDIYIYIRTHTDIYIYTHTDIYIYTHTDIYIYTYRYIYIHIRIYIYTYRYIYIYTHTYRYIYIYIYMVSIKSFPNYKHLFSKCLPGHAGTLLCTSEEFQPWIIFQQDGAPPHWG
jgi:hypothetical protein